MKTIQYYTVAASLFACVAMSSCGSNKSVLSSTRPSSTTMECVQITSDGNFIIEVQSVGKDVENAKEEALKYSVRSLLFDGIQGSTSNRIQGHKPLVTDPSTLLDKQNYFQQLFDSGDYRLYAELIPNDLPRIVKVDNGYKIKVKVILKKNLLRRRLEKDGIIKSLSSTFN